MNRAFVAGSNGPALWEPLSYARKDADDIARCLAAPRCGFEVEMPPAGARPSAVREQLYAVAETCSDSDTFVCYFSGHGILEQGSLFLLWDETDLKRLLTTGLPASALTEAMRGCRASNKLLILDCCHAGAAVGQGFRDASEVRAPDLVAPENHLVLMASDRLQRARELDALRGGLLTQQLCAALTDAFVDVAGADRRLSIGDAKAWLESQALRHNGEDPDHAVPIPYLFGQQRGEFFFTAPRGEWQPTTFELDGCSFVILPFQWTGDGAPPWVLGIAQHPVVNREYRAFVEQTGATTPVGERFSGGRWHPGFEPWRTPGFDDPLQPVVCTSLADAWAYTFWFAGRAHRNRVSSEFVGGWEEFRVPTQAEWDVAAFGTEHPSRDPRSWLSSSPLIHQMAEGPAPIDATGARDNRLGVSDLIGNVWEWCDNRTRDSEGEDVAEHGSPFLVAGSVTADNVVVGVGEVVGVDSGRDADPADIGRAAIRGGGFLDDLTRTAPFVNEWELRDRRRTRHSDLGFRIAVRLPCHALPDDIRDRVEARDLHASDTASMRMPPAA